MEFLLEFLSRIYYLAFGSNRLRQHEKACLESWCDLLSDSSKLIVSAQLERFDLVQRQARGMKTVFYSIRDPDYKKWGDDILLPYKGIECVFEGVLRGVIGDVIESVKFRICLHKGRLFSIEFTSEPGALSSIAGALEVEKGKVLIDLDER